MILTSDDRCTVHYLALHVQEVSAQGSKHRVPNLKELLKGRENRSTTTAVCQVGDSSLVGMEGALGSRRHLPNASHWKTKLKIRILVTMQREERTF